MSVKCKVIVPNNKYDDMLYKYITNEFRKGYVEVGPNKIIMPQYYSKIADIIENFEVRDSDIWIVTHPKTGTTWCQEMLWLLLNDLNYKGAKSNLDERYTYLELQAIFDSETICSKFPEFKSVTVLYDSVNITKNDKRNPRLIKTHLPWCLLPKAIRNNTTNAKIVYVARNPKDTCVSYYHHQRLIEGFSGSFNDFYQLFIAGRLNYGPFWNHILDFWKRREDSNILYLKYEDMKRDLISVINRTSKFFNKKALSEEEMNILVDHLSFEKMKNNPYVNYDNVVQWNQTFMKSIDGNGKFMRSGKVGSYKSEITPEIEFEFDKWIKENTQNINITF